MPSYRYRVVDVFTENKLEGNPLAVFTEAEGLDTATMQKLAQELNLSETTFLFPPTRPDCVARVRIFTPANEMRFAGHPTIGTAWVLLNERRAPNSGFALEELVGPVPLRIDGKLLWLKTPAITFESTVPRDTCAKLVGVNESDLLECTPQVVSAGNPCLFIALKNREAVDRTVCDTSVLRGITVSKEPLCVFVFAPEPTGAYSRMFAPLHNIIEDPATGSATGPLAAYMMAHNLCTKTPGTRLISEQGTKMGRRSILHILIGNEGSIEVGGAVAPLAQGTMDL